jgi:CubicO group peptidase (beta-lactamase class C family)
VLQLVDAGRVSLDDSVAEHLPEFRPADPRGADITVRQLLDQTSGLADREVHELNRRQPATLAEATISLNSARLVAAPGRRFNYHNPNYHVAARLVEVVRGETFENYLRTHVFGWAGMPASTTTNTDDQPVAGLADGHVIAYGQPVAIPAPNTFGAGSGDVVSTAADMADWLIVHANGGRAADGVRLVSEHSLRELHTASAPSGYALGWDTDGPADAPTRPVHSGNLLTYSAYQAVLPNSSYGLALLFNSGSALLFEQTAIFHGLLNIVEGTDSTPAVPGSTFRPSTFCWGASPSIWTILQAHRQLHSRTRRWVVYPLLVVLALSAIGGGYETVRESIDATAYPAPGQLIDVGRHRLHLNCTGTGSPTVVLEPGHGEVSSAMGWIAPAVSQDTRVCVSTARVTDGATPPTVPRTQWKQLATCTRCSTGHTSLDHTYSPVTHLAASMSSPSPPPTPTRSPASCCWNPPHPTRAGPHPPRPGPTTSSVASQHCCPLQPTSVRPA